MINLGSSATPAEYLRVNGSLPIDMQETLVDQSAQLEQLQGVAANISEAMAQFPAEDFLSQIEGDLQSLCKRLRGENREELKRILGVIEDVAQCTFNSADYGREELHKALKAFNA